LHAASVLALVSLGGFLSAAALGKDASRGLDTTTVATTAPTPTTIPKPDPPPVTTPTTTTRRKRVVSPRVRAPRQVTHVAPTPVAPPPPPPVLSQPPPAVVAPSRASVGKRDATRRVAARHQRRALVKDTNIVHIPKLRDFRAAVGVFGLVPLAGKRLTPLFASDTASSGWPRLVVVLILLAGVLLSLAAMAPPQALPVRVARPIVHRRSELASLGLVAGLACAFAFILTHGF
jgi:hypothetical protein